MKDHEDHEDHKKKACEGHDLVYIHEEGRKSAYSQCLGCMVIICIHISMQLPDVTTPYSKIALIKVINYI